MRIAILGTRGIPNHYGGFEQFAEYFSVFLHEQGHEVFVYNSHNHPYQEKKFKSVNLIHIYDPEYCIGTVGQFIYDLGCIWDSRSRDFDVILQLGYTSSAIWGFLFPTKSKIVTNLDGLEWKRSKYNSIVQRALHFFESLAVKQSDALIADSKGIQSYIEKKYQKQAEYIAYGASVLQQSNSELLRNLELKKEEYYLLIARLVPENNIEMVLDGYQLSDKKFPMIVIGNYTTKYGNYLKDKYARVKQIKFLGALFDINLLNCLRFYSNLYFHGHSVGGTNPSLLEAMGCSALIVAHQNEFNSAILENNAFYFSNSEHVKKHLNNVQKSEYLDWIAIQKNKIEREFSWSKINKQYLDLLVKTCNE